MFKHGLIKLSLVVGVASVSTALYSVDTEIVLASQGGSPELVAPKSDSVQVTDIVLAQKKKKKKRSSKGRKRILSSEKSVKAKRGSKTNLDFDAVDISGQRKTPLGSMVGTVKDRKGFNFIQIRKEWHNEMVQSASNLD